MQLRVVFRRDDAAPSSTWGGAYRCLPAVNTCGQRVQVLVGRAHGALLQLTTADCTYVDVDLAARIVYTTAHRLEDALRTATPWNGLARVVVGDLVPGAMATRGFVAVADRVFVHVNSLARVCGTDDSTDDDDDGTTSNDDA